MVRESGSMNNYVVTDSTYMVIDSTANWYKLPSSKKLSSLTNQIYSFRNSSDWELWYSSTAQKNSANDIISYNVRENVFSFNPPSLNFMTTDSSVFNYRSSQLDFYYKFEQQPNSNIQLVDSVNVSCNNRNYPIESIVYNKQNRWAFSLYSKETSTFNNNNQELRFTYEVYSPQSNRYFPSLISNKVYDNQNKLIGDSVRDFRNSSHYFFKYTYEGKDLLDSAIQFDINGNVATILNLRKNYYTANRLDSTIVSYSGFGSPTLTNSSKTWFTYPVYSSSLNSVSAEQNGKVFPNPVSEILFIESPKEIKFIEIHSSNGSLIKLLDQPRSSEEIDFSTFPSGLYFIKLGDETFKVLKVEN